MRPSRPTAEIDLDAVDAAALQYAARGIGAFLLRGSRLDWPLAARVRELAQRVFALPNDDLDAIAMVRSPHFRGYSHVGSERTRGRADLREQLDFAPEREADIDAVSGPPYRRLPGPNQWPAALPELRPALLAWMQHCEALARELTAAMFAALDLPLARVADAFEPDPWTRLKIVRYPGMPARGAQGVGAHSDTGWLTLILDDGSGGLFVRDGDDAFEVRSAPDTLIVVLGRTMGAVDDAITPAMHYVVSPPPGEERVSIPYFFAPRLDFAVDGRPFGDSALDTLVRSHPTVAERHHPELLVAR